jgi:anti-sigma-K factor RskA
MHDLAAGYALDALEPAERAVFEEHLAECAACRQEVTRMAESLTVLAGSEQPPDRLRSGLLEAVRFTPQVVAPPRRSRLLPLLAAALALVVVALGVIIVELQGRLDRSRAVADLLAVPDAGVVEVAGVAAETARLVFSEAGGRGVFVATGIEPVPADRTYQLWVIAEAGATSAGIFTPEGDQTVVVVVEGDFAEAVAFGVTVEPEGGSARPTSDPVLIGEL